MPRIVILKAQVEKATQTGYAAKAGTGREFIVFDTTYARGLVVELPI